MKMIHPDIDAVADVVNVEGYNAVWAPRGWVLLGEAEAFATEALAQPVKSLEDLKVVELEALHSAAGLEFPGGRVLKADLIEQLRERFPSAELVNGADEPVTPAEPADPEQAAALAAAEADEAAKTAPLVVPTPAAVAGRNTDQKN